MARTEPDYARGNEEWQKCLTFDSKVDTMTFDSMLSLWRVTDISAE
jgi:hypothetical protein